LYSGGGGGKKSKTGQERCGHSIFILIGIGKEGKETSSSNGSLYAKLVVEIVVERKGNEPNR